MAVVKVHHNNFFTMNTRLETVFWGRSKADCEVVLAKIKRTVLDLENILSSFIPHSETYILNKAGKKTNIHVSDYLFNVIKRCSEFKQKTLGYFDITFNRAFDTSPQENNSDRVSNNKFKDCNIIFNEKNKTLCFRNEKTTVDFGGIGKGLALEDVEKILNFYEIENAFISFGESTIITRGRHPHGEYWPFGISNLFKPKEIVYSFRCNNHSISTSATIQNVENLKELRHHIVDPKSGMLITTPKMISVKSESPVIAEVLSTALLAADPKTQHKIVSNFENNEIIEVIFNQDNSPVITKLN